MKLKVPQDYRDLRRQAYPAISDQLDTIFHEGVEKWREDIAAIKAKYPKPTE